VNSLMINSLDTLRQAANLARDAEGKECDIEFNKVTRTVTLSLWQCDGQMAKYRHKVWFVWDKIEPRRRLLLILRSVDDFSIEREKGACRECFNIGDIRRHDLNELRVLTYSGIMLHARTRSIDGELTETNDVDYDRPCISRVFSLRQPVGAE